LNLASPQSENAPALLELFRRVLLVDPGYVARVKRHYEMFRSKVGGAKTSRKKTRGK
jgi:hypothetical protein